jgi:hypothetical protein
LFEFAGSSGFALSVCGLGDFVCLLMMTLTCCMWVSIRCVSAVCVVAVEGWLFFKEQKPGAALEGRCEATRVYLLRWRLLLLFQEVEKADDGAGAEKESEGEEMRRRLARSRQGAKGSATRRRTLCSLES